MNNRLLIFAKYPEAGKVKTRLARSIGSERAALLYKEMVETVARKTTPLNGEYQRTLCFDPPQKENDFRQWFPSLETKSQGDGDLGQRMSAAFQESLAKGSDRAVLIGTDCTDIDRSLLCEAFDRLDQADLVLGPANDGGYYLIGMKKPHPFLFEEIPWSTETVFQETIKKAKEARLRIELLKTLSDLDEES